MLDDILLETCAKGFEATAKRLFEIDRQSGRADCEVPFLGSTYNITSSEEYRAQLLERVVNALIARQRFAWTGPTWADELPLHYKTIDEMKNDADPQQRVVGLYAYSLHRLDWDHRTHPPFGAFCRGLMACRHTPKELRTDAGLRKEFPPQRLAGLADGCLYWRTPEEISQGRRLRAWIRRMPTVGGPPSPDIRHTAGHC